MRKFKSRTQRVICSNICSACKWRREEFEFKLWNVGLQTILKWGRDRGQVGLGGWGWGDNPWRALAGTQKPIQILGAFCGGLFRQFVHQVVLNSQHKGFAWCVLYFSSGLINLVLGTSTSFLSSFWLTSTQATLFEQNSEHIAWKK